MEKEVEKDHPRRAGPDLNYLLSAASLTWQQEALEAGYLWLPLDKDICEKIESYFGEEALEAHNQIEDCEIELNRNGFMAFKAKQGGNEIEEARRASIMRAYLFELHKEWAEHIAKKRRARFKVYRTNAAFTVLGAITGALASSMIGPQLLNNAAGWIATFADKVL